MLEGRNDYTELILLLNYRQTHWLLVYLDENCEIQDGLIHEEYLLKSHRDCNVFHKYKLKERGRVLKLELKTELVTDETEWKAVTDRVTEVRVSVYLDD